MTELTVRMLSSLTSRAQRGAGMAEYVLLLALVAAAMVAGFTGLVNAMIGQVGNIAGLVGN